MAPPLAATHPECAAALSPLQVNPALRLLATGPAAGAEVLARGDAVGEGEAADGEEAVGLHRAPGAAPAGLRDGRSSGNN
jgi:hypothetical protein